MEILDNQAVKLTVPSHIVNYITDNIEKSEILETKGKINIKAIINIDVDTGEITIEDDSRRIKFSFNNNYILLL